MARRIAIGMAWWLAAAYALQFASVMYDFPAAFGALAALPVAVLVATTRPQRLRRPADNRRLYRPNPELVVGGEPSTVPNR